MTDREARYLHALARMVDQYLTDRILYKGLLDHCFVNAGEEAMDLLAEYGLIRFDEGQSRIAQWTEEGRTLLNSNGPTTDLADLS